MWYKSYIYMLLCICLIITYYLKLIYFYDIFKFDLLL